MRFGPNVRRSGSHKLACLSLYHGLLKQCHRFPSTTISNSLSQLVRYRFEKDKTLRAHVQIRNALQFGYEILEIIKDAAAGSHVALRVLTQSVSSTTIRLQFNGAVRAHWASLRFTPSTKASNIVKRQQVSANKASQVHRPESTPVLERPLPRSALPGNQRVVPKFVATQGIPFLRYGRPQPQSLSRIIQQLSAAEQKRWDKRAKLEEDLILAEYEDEWDNLVAVIARHERVASSFTRSNSNGGIAEQWFAQKIHRLDLSWTEEIKAADNDIRLRLIRNYRDRSEMASKMWAVLVKERTLAQQEKEQRQCVKYRNRKTTTARQSTRRQ